MAVLVADWSDFFITDAGLRMRQKAIAEKLIIKYTRAAIGDGVPDQESDVWTLNALISYSEEAHVKKSYSLETTHHLVIEIDNKDFTRETLMREIGVHAQLLDRNESPIDGEILYGYAYTRHGYDPIPTGTMQKRTWTISANTGISRTSDVKILCDDALDKVSREELEDRLSSIEANRPLVRINHRLGCYPLIMAGKLQYGLGMAGFGEGPLGGTEMEQVAARALYHDPDSLTVRTVKAVADLGTPMLHQLSPTSYTVTFQGNETDSVYLQLYTDATYVTTPKVIKVSPNMGLKVLEE